MDKIKTILSTGYVNINYADDHHYKQSTYFLFCLLILKRRVYISGIVLLFMLMYANVFAGSNKNYIAFLGDTIYVELPENIATPLTLPLTAEKFESCYSQLQNNNLQTVIDTIKAYKNKRNLDDWIFYHLIRATAEKISPKALNYENYTLYKWYLLLETGYQSMIAYNRQKLLLYVQSNDEVYEIPYRMYHDKQFVCLNYHDYGNIDFTAEKFDVLPVSLNTSGKSFSYKINHIPEIKQDLYTTKELQFDYYQDKQRFKILVNTDIQKIFANYPILNYSYYFNIPLSNITYGSLVSLLKQHLEKMNEHKGVDYLMRFSRYAFGFETDTKQFGKEKRLTPEQTLLYNDSDCEDRAAFFFYLVKEIYNLPMIVVNYPQHITIAVRFSKPLHKKPLLYKGEQYFVCEPTPQGKDLEIGQIIPQFKNLPFDVVYEYNPQQ